MDAPDDIFRAEDLHLSGGHSGPGPQLWRSGSISPSPSLAPPPAPLPKTSIFDPDLRGAVANYPDAVKETRTVFTAATPQGTRTVTNCADYLKLLDQGVRSLVVDPTDAHSAYGNCPLLFVLRQAREPATYLAPLSQLARTVAERLDATTLDDSLRPFPVSDRPGSKPTREPLHRR